MPDPIPVRLQRRRTKGFKLQEHSRAINGLPCVCCTRPGKWGNPFKVEGPHYVNYKNGRGKAPYWSCVDTTGGREAISGLDSPEIAAEKAIEAFRDSLTPELRQLARKELHGKNLACFCPRATKCHVDVLLEIANSEEPS